MLQPLYYFIADANATELGGTKHSDFSGITVRNLPWLASAPTTLRRHPEMQQASLWQVSNRRISRLIFMDAESLFLIPKLEFIKWLNRLVAAQECDATGVQ